MTQEAKADTCLGASIAAQKYGPPLVGIADTISAMPKPTNIAANLVRSSTCFALFGYRRTEEADDNPSHRHHTWTSGIQAISEEAAFLVSRDKRVLVELDIVRCQACNNTLWATSVTVWSQDVPDVR